MAACALVVGSMLLIAAPANAAPSISLAASPSSLTIPDQGVLWATASESLAGTPYSIAIVDDAAGQDFQFCPQNQLGNDTTTCGAFVSASWSMQDHPQALHYHAELRMPDGSSAGTSDSITIPVTAHTFEPDLEATPSVVTIPDWSVVIANAGESLAGTPFSMAIVDDRTDQTVQFCPQGQMGDNTTTCGTYAATTWSMQDDPQPLRYHAEIRWPDGHVAAETTQVTVDVRAHEFGLSLEAEPKVITVPESSAVTLTVGESLAATPFSTRIINHDTGETFQFCPQSQMGNNWTTCGAGAGASWAMNVDPKPMHFHAELVWPDGSTETSSDPVAVDVRQRRFDVALSFDEQSASGDPQWLATATSHLTQWGAPYRLVIRDADHAQLAVCFSSDSCGAFVGPGSYRATVEDADGNVFGSSGYFTLAEDDDPEPDMVEGLDLVDLAGLYAGAREICTALLFAPGTHALSPDVSDEYLACDAAVTGGTVDKIKVLKAVLAVGGAGTVGALWYLQWGGTLDYPIPAPGEGTIDDLVPPSGKVTDPTWPVAAVTAALLARSQTLTHSEATEVARQCLYEGAAAGTSAQNRCMNLDIFVTGDDYREATNLDLSTIARVPRWSVLTYVADQNEPLRGWYNDEPYRSHELNYCTGPRPGTQCHEYPYLSTAQGGPPTNSTDPFPGLRPISPSINLGQGAKLGNFYNNGPPSGCRLSPGDSFFVIAMPPASRVPTQAICKE